MVINLHIRFTTIDASRMVSLMKMIRTLQPRSKAQIRCTAILPMPDDAKNIKELMRRRPPSTDYRMFEQVGGVLNGVQKTGLELARDYIEKIRIREESPDTEEPRKITKTRCINVLIRVLFDFLDYIEPKEEDDRVEMESLLSTCET